MRPTRPGFLVGAAALAAALAWGAVTIANAYGSVPEIPLLAAPALVLLAAWLVFTAFSFRARLQRRPGTKPVNPFVAARMAALAKAASLGGSLVLGAYAGITVYFLFDLDTSFDRQRALRAALAVLAAGALVAAALFLERVCRIPEPPEDEDDPGYRDGGHSATEA